MTVPLVSIDSEEGEGLRVPLTCRAAGLACPLSGTPRFTWGQDDDGDRLTPAAVNATPAHHPVKAIGELLWGGDKDEFVRVRPHVRLAWRRGGRKERAWKQADR